MSNSMLNALSATSAANTALMSGAVGGNRLWLFVEGPCDYKAYDKFIKVGVVKIIIAGGKEKAIEALNHYLRNKKEQEAFAIVDADYDHVQGNKYPEPIFLTDYYDILNLAFGTIALQYVLNNSGNHGLVADKMRDFIYEQVSIVGHLRLTNEKHDIGIGFGNLPHEIMGRSVEETIKFLFVCRHDIKLTPAQLMKLVNDELSRSYPRELICQGHDLCKSLSVYLRTHGSNVKAGPETIEDALIAAFDSQDFKKTSLYQAVKEWGQKLKIEIFRD